LLAVLLGYTKMWAFHKLLDTDFPDSPAARPILEGYFPRLLRERFADHFQDHTLRREIVATAAVNHVINCGGITLIPRLMKSGKAGIGTAVAAHVNAERQSGAGALRFMVLGAGMPAGEEHKVLLDIEGIIEAAAMEFLEGKPVTGASNAIDELRSRLKS
jgi:glutamate dehydrogenase